MKTDYTKLTFTELIDKIEVNRFFDLPRMVREAFTRLLTRVEALEDAPSGGIESITGDFVDNTDPLNPILGDPRPYKVYTALLTQSGTNAPVATVLENTLGVTPTYGYDSTGTFIINTITVFPFNKIGFIFEPIAGIITLDKPSYEGGNEIIFKSKNVSDVAANDVLYGNLVEIRVYN